MAKPKVVYVDRDANNKINFAGSVRQPGRRNERVSLDDPEVQAFLNSPTPPPTDDAMLDAMLEYPLIKAIVKKLSDIEGKSEFQVKNELKVLAKQG